MHAQLYCPAISSQKAHFQQASFTGRPWCFMLDAGSSCSGRVYLGPWLPMTGSRGGSRLLDRKTAKPRRQDGGRHFRRGGKNNGIKRHTGVILRVSSQVTVVDEGKAEVSAGISELRGPVLSDWSLFPRRLNFWWARRSTRWSDRDDSRDNRPSQMVMLLLVIQKFCSNRGPFGYCKMTTEWLHQHRKQGNKDTVNIW